MFSACVSEIVEATLPPSTCSNGAASVTITPGVPAAIVTKDGSTPPPPPPPPAGH